MCHWIVFVVVAFGVCFALFWLDFFRSSAPYCPFLPTRALHTTTRNARVWGNAVFNREWQNQLLANKKQNSEALAKTECRRLQQDRSYSLSLSYKNADTLERFTKSLKWQQAIERIEFCAATTLMVYCKHTVIHGPQGKRCQEEKSAACSIT